MSERFRSAFAAPTGFVATATRPRTRSANKISDGVVRTTEIGSARIAVTSHESLVCRLDRRAA